MPSSRSALWKKSASWMVSGLGLVTSTKAASRDLSSAFTLAARSLKPSYIPSKASMKAVRSRRKSAPVKRASVRSARPVGTARSLKPILPAFSIGPSTIFMALLSSTSRMRLEAWRKSSALEVGGVSSTTTSKRFELYTSYTFSMAMYSRLPAMAVESVW